MFDSGKQGIDNPPFRPSVASMRRVAMRSLAGCLALGLLLAVSPALAEDAGEQSTASTGAALSPSAANAGGPSAPPMRSLTAAIGSDMAAAPPAVRELKPLPPPPPPITLVLNTDLRAQRLTVVENGK